MLEKMPEQKSEGEKNNLKYPLEVIADKNKAAEIEAGLTRKEIINILKICQEEGYGDSVDLFKKYANKSGFKRMAICPFSVNFHVIPLRKNNSCFVSSMYIPRLKNLQKIMPDMAEEGTELVIRHEREHGYEKAFDLHKDKLNSFNKNNGFEDEFLTNCQKTSKLTKEKNINGGGSEEINFIMQAAIKEYIYAEILERGAEVLENINEEQGALNYFKYNYLLQENDELSEKYKNSGGNCLNEFINYKKEGKLKEFYDLFLEEFRKVKAEVLEKYNRHMKENNIPDFYDREDRECEDLRIKIINRLNQEKLI